MVKTIHHRIQVYKCLAVIDIGSKHENRDCKKNKFKQWKQCKIYANVLHILSKCLWIIVEDKDINMCL